MAKTKAGKRRVILLGAIIAFLLLGAFVAWRFWPGGPVNNAAAGPLTVKAVAGTTQLASLQVSRTQTTGPVSFNISGTIAGLVTVPLAPNTAYDQSAYPTLPVLVTVPADRTDGTYTGQVEVRDGSKTVAVGQMTVIVQKTSASFIPQGVAQPAAERIVTPADSQIPMVKDELVVKLELNKDAAPQKIKDIAVQTNGAIIGALPDGVTFQLRFPGATTDDLAKKKSAIEWTIGVRLVSYNIIAIGNLNPDDMGDAAWKDATQDKRTWGQRLIGLPKAWDKTTGSKSVRLGIIDDGFYGMHEDLRVNVNRVTGRSLDGLIDYFNRYSPWRSPHGTEVAGTACAEGDNGVGIAGVMWQCALGLYDAGGWVPVSNSYDSASVVAMMEQAANDKMRVVNMSFGVGTDSALCKNHTAFSMTTKGAITNFNAQIKDEIQTIKDSKRDVLWVMAAGNSCRDITEVAPASLANKFDNVLAVAGVDRPQDAAQAAKPKLGWYSEYGEVDIVAAPGTDIYTTSADYKQKSKASIYDYGSGTSLAAPFVTGLAGLMWSVHDGFTAQQVKQCIMDSAESAGQLVDQQDRNQYETHVINAPEALNCQPDPDPDSPLGTAQPCVFSMAVLPEQCASINPTVTVKFTNVAGSSNCLFNSHLQWVAGDSKTEQVDQLVSLKVNGSVSLGTHTFSGAGKHLISHTVPTVSSGPCVILDSLYEFTLLPSKK